ncbi:MAG TPA: hypothetical protein VN622_14200 [Clostridia bacterium]|nr:hypothetical protein [Clostridia bacterium]
MAGEEMVHVRLSASGIERAGEGTLRMYGSRYAFEFTPGEVQRVTRSFDWAKVLSNEVNESGEPLFELAVDSTEEGA